MTFRELSKTHRLARFGLAISTLRGAAWLGWQTESNWASPWLFALYAIVRPVSAAALLVVMYLVVTGGQTAGPAFAYIYLGQAFFVFVTATIESVGQTFIDDRERWQTLRYIHLAPASPYLYLAGRGAARFVASAAGVAVTLAAGVAFLGLRLDPAAIDYPLALAGLAVGAVATISLGIAVAAVSLVVARHSWSMAEAVAAALHVLSGAIFPIDVLPSALQAISLALPLTYWLELLRRALGVASTSAILQPWTTAQLALALLATTAAALLATHGLYRLCETTARRRGLIDNTSAD